MAAAQQPAGQWSVLVSFLTAMTGSLARKSLQRGRVYFGSEVKKGHSPLWWGKRHSRTVKQRSHL